MRFLAKNVPFGLRVHQIITVIMPYLTVVDLDSSDSFSARAFQLVTLNGLFNVAIRSFKIHVFVTKTWTFQLLLI